MLNATDAELEWWKGVWDQAVKNADGTIIKVGDADMVSLKLQPAKESTLQGEELAEAMGWLRPLNEKGQNWCQELFASLPLSEQIRLYRYFQDWDVRQWKFE